MNFTKTPPTEAGDYWFKQKVDGKIFAMNIFQARGRLRCLWGDNSQHSVAALVSNGSIEVGDRIGFPADTKPAYTDGPPPENCRVAACQSGGGWYIGVRDDRWPQHIQRHVPLEMDHDPAEIPLPRRFRGTWKNEPCVGVEYESGWRTWLFADGEGDGAMKDLSQVVVTEWID